MPCGREERRRQLLALFGPTLRLITVIVTVNNSDASKKGELRYCDSQDDVRASWREAAM